MKVVWITSAEYVSNYQIYLEFNDHCKGIVDLQGKLTGTIFESLQAIDYFKQFKVNSWTIEWPNGADVSPEYLYELVIKQNVSKTSL